MEAKVEVWEPRESREEVQNLFITFKGDFLEEEAFETDLKVCVVVCQLKKDIYRHEFNTCSLNRHFSGSSSSGSMLAYVGDQI